MSRPRRAYDLLMINGAGSAGCRIVGSLVQLS
jgi:hypothetical protein